MTEHKGNTLYLECYSGISGDMTVAALLDLGATEKNLRETLDKLPVGGYELRVSRVKKNGLDVCDFDVQIEGEKDSHNGMHHGQNHSESYGHCHGHRTWKEISCLLEEAQLAPGVLARAKKIFQILAEAEGTVHGIPAGEVHFHEVGAVDSIVDIVGTAACMEELQVDKILVSRLSEGRGHIRCQHGILPIPVPAVAEIASRHHLSLKITEQQGEMVTPTGAAIAALSGGKSPESFQVKAIGLGAGKREYATANVLRAMLIEEES